MEIERDGTAAAAAAASGGSSSSGSSSSSGGSSSSGNDLSFLNVIFDTVKCDLTVILCASVM